VNTDSSWLKPAQIRKAEKHYNAKYVLESDLLGTDKFSGATFWANIPAAIFYTETAHPRGSNYFALYLTDFGELHICDALPSIRDVVFTGIEAEGEVIYSRYRHDFRSHKNGAFIDGGRDYYRIGGDEFKDYNIVKFKVVDGKIEFIDYPTVPDVDYHNQEFD
jgi:hypothetical protein